MDARGDTPMKRNVEIKVAVADLAALRRRTEALAEEGPALLDQEDTFFHCPHGRLKLRRFADARPAELIAYERPDAAGPKESRYVVTPTQDPDGLCRALSLTVGIRGIVRKRRLLYAVGQTRVHLDTVAGLGDFMELEVVLSDEQDTADGTAIARRLMTELGITESRVIEHAYIDLLEQIQDGLERGTILRRE